MEKLAEKTFVIRYWSDCGEEMRIKVKAIDAKTEQEYFDKYIELDKDFVELFKYDIKPID